MRKQKSITGVMLVAASLAVTPVTLHAEIFTGTAFAVSEDGDLVTNEHVISGCGETMTVRQGDFRSTGTVRVSDQSLDLAVVRVSPTSLGGTPRHHAIAALRDSPPLRAGEQAISYGFPLIGQLATEGNLTVGNVSALHGLGDGPHYIQITTPVQPGNSGGPLLDSSGNVIGVVAAKLNALKVMRATGDIPQNVNFAVGLGTLKSFLAANTVRVTAAASNGDLRPADIGERAKVFTYLIECETETVASDQEQIPVPKMPNYRGVPAPQSAPLKPIQVDATKLKFSDLRRPYPAIAPEMFELIVTNAGRDRVTELTIGFLNTMGKACFFKPEDYDGLKRFTTNLLPGDSVTLRGDFGTRAQKFCIISAWGPPEGRTACSSGTVPPDVGIAACTRTIESGEIQGTALATMRTHRGWHLKRKGDLDHAILDYDAAIKLDPKNAVGYRLRGIAYSDKGEHDRAISDFSEALRLDPKDAGIYSYRGGEYELKGENDHAIADLSEAIRFGRIDATVYYLRGRAFDNKGEYRRAILDFGKAIAVDRKFVSAYNSRASSYRSMGEYDLAIADGNEAIKLAPQDASSYLSRGLSYQGKRDHDRAIPDLSEAIRLNPHNSPAYLLRGFSYKTKGEHDRAIADLSEAIRMNPHSSSAYLMRGFSYKKKGEYDRAIADFDKFIQLGTGDRANGALAYGGRGEIYFDFKHDYGGAIADFTEAIRLDPKFEKAYIIRGRAYEEKGEFERAVADFHSALAINPDAQFAIEGIRRVEAK